ARGRSMWGDREGLWGGLGLPFRRPEPFPQHSVLAARVGLYALDQTWGEDFCRALFRAEFGGGGRIDDAATIGRVLAGLGVEPAPALAGAQAGAIKARLRAQTEGARPRRIFGAPRFRTARGEA